jgi:hypothetical protein
MNPSSFRRRSGAVWRWLLLGVLCSGPAVLADTSYWSARVQNPWFNTNQPAGAISNFAPRSTTLYQGHAGYYKTDTNATWRVPSNSVCKLWDSSFGQVADSLQSRYRIGDVLAAPVGVNLNVAPTIEPSFRAIWSPQTHTLYAGDGGMVRVTWTLLDGSTRTILYQISTAPAQPPVRIYWTEGQNSGPPVQFGNSYKVTIFYNSMITTNDLWIAEGNALRAARGATGRVLLEYSMRTTNGVEIIGGEIVEVLEPVVNRLPALIGERLLPMDESFGDNGLYGSVTRGLGSVSAPNDIYVNVQQGGPKDGWIIPIRRNDESWKIEVYWKRKSILDVLWPYEVDHYLAEWPEISQLYVIGNSVSNGVYVKGPSVPLPSSLQPTLYGQYAEPPGHAQLISNNTAFTASQPGYALLQYKSQDNDVWYEVIHSVPHDDPSYYVLDPVDWEIGKKLEPVIGNKALLLNGHNSYASAVNAVTAPTSFTVEAWFKSSSTQGGKLIGFGNAKSIPSATYDRHIYLTDDGRPAFGVGTGVKQAVVATNICNEGAWHHVAGTFSPASGLSLYVDGALATNNASFTNAQTYSGYWRVGGDQLSGWPLNPSTGYLQGAVAEVSIWNGMLEDYEIQALMLFPLAGDEDGLTTYYDFQGIKGSNLPNLAVHGGPGMLYGAPRTVREQPDLWTTLLTNFLNFTASPGYIHPTGGNRFNTNYYAYPSTNSVIMAVNTNELEVWWSNLSIETGMPARVSWPSLVIRYNAVWPTNASQIVIAGGQGSGLLPVAYAEPNLYVQNHRNLPGYNPNEEHAFIMQNRIYALRDDLNKADSSEPFVLLQYRNSLTSEREMKLYRVLATNSQYAFVVSNGVAGLLIQPPAPLSALPKCALSHPADGPVWQDRNGDFWAMAAGQNGGPVTNIMRYFYPTQHGFWFPDPGVELPSGTEVPWLSRQGITGTPVDVRYIVHWPENCPELRVAETLAAARNDWLGRPLPAIRGQKSVDVLYQQCSPVFYVTNINVACAQYGYANYCWSNLTVQLIQDPCRRSVSLIDPTVAQGVTLGSTPSSLGIDVELNPGDGCYYFTGLPPSLRSRLYYNPSGGAGGNLRFKGLYASPITGDPYFLLNQLEGSLSDTNSDRYLVHSLSAGTEWQQTIAALATNAVLITTNTTPFDSLALSAAYATGTGYVTLAFNNSTTLAAPGDPISLSILKIVPRLYQGDLKVLLSDNPLDEKASLRHSGDFGGRLQDYEFRWYYTPDTGSKPVASSVNGQLDSPWIALNDRDNEFTLKGPGILALKDLYFTCQYRSLVTNNPAGTNAWSGWTDPQLLNGWVKRVLSAVNPYEQRIRNYQTTADNTLVSMIAQAGQRYSGSVPLNESALNDYGLIPIYVTVEEVAKEMGPDGLPPLDDEGANNAIMLAAGRVSDLYMLLGNEAYADACDPTIGFSTADGQYGAEATSIFCFMNQVPSLLEEELALLRGRDGGNASVNPPLTQAPVYNRLPWNFTRDITGGEVAYALNYNVRDQSGNVSRSMDQTTAAQLYPQGHGDAWGHYLTAIRQYYDLLRHPYFTWRPRSESVNVGDGSQTIDVSYLHERRFAETAIARARAGADIVNLTYRQKYVEDPVGLWTGFRDSNTNRAWGTAEWASRVGQAAFFDWAMATAILPAEDTSHTGIQKVDRTTVPELTELTGWALEIQNQMDHADAALNPLGLGSGVVPFDISPAEIDAGKTHFEQVYSRAIQTLNNAKVAFDRAADCTQLLRRQADSLTDFNKSVSDAERDYNSRLIELFGYPYSDDIGPGKTYPQGYQGPDLYHFNYVDLYDLVGIQPTVSLIQVALPVLEYVDSNLTLNVTATNMVSFALTPDGLLAKPPSWSGTRRASGEIQLALQDFVVAYYNLQQALSEYDALEQKIMNLYGFWVATAQSGAAQLAKMKEHNLLQQIYTREIFGFTVAAGTLQTVAEIAGDQSDYTIEVLPKSVIAGLAVGGDLTWPIRSALKVPALVTAISAGTGSLGFNIAAGTLGNTKELLGFQLQEWMAENGAPSSVPLDLQQLANQQAAKQIEIQKLMQTVSAAQERHKQLLARGQRLWDERTTFRTQTATELQDYRYKDMAFRIFRNDALQKYRSAFDLAARYVYLAAKAYDYETGLLRSEVRNSPGQQFLSQVVRARALGSIVGGAPLTGGPLGDPGLADVMARMKGDWDVLKGRLGFNNPATETGRFSLRTELFRIVPDASGDQRWRETLARYAVDNLFDVPVFKQYCQPFEPSQSREPGLVIPFSTSVRFGENFFGNKLAAGDNAYDSSHFATKIRSVGVWFSNFNAAFNTNSSAGGGLANQPRVYIVPAGADIVRAPTVEGNQYRIWNVLDQALPLPYNIGAGDMNDPNWIAANDSLSGSLAQIRRYPSLRAYHDAGYNESQLTYNSRLVGRSVWNTQWYLIIPAGTLLDDRTEALYRFIDGARLPNSNLRDHNGVKDIKLFFNTYSYSGN